MQTATVVLIVVVALAYLGKRLYASFSSDSCTGSGCAKCAAVDANKILQRIEKGSKA